MEPVRVGRRPLRARLRGGDGDAVNGARFLASFDIEDWFHAENLKEYLPTDDWSALEARVEPNTHALLDILAEARRNRRPSSL